MTQDTFLQKLPFQATKLPGIKATKFARRPYMWSQERVNVKRKISTQRAVTGQFRPVTCSKLTLWPQLNQTKPRVRNEHSFGQSVTQCGLDLCDRGCWKRHRASWYAYFNKNNNKKKIKKSTAVIPKPRSRLLTWVHLSSYLASKDFAPFILTLEICQHCKQTCKQSKQNCHCAPTAVQLRSVSVCRHEATWHPTIFPNRTNAFNSPLRPERCATGNT